MHLVTWTFSPVAPRICQVITPLLFCVLVSGLALASRVEAHGRSGTQVPKLRL